MPAITNWTAAWLAAGAGALANLLGFLPNLLAAIVILLIGWAVATVLAIVVDKLLDAVRFDDLMRRANVDEAIARSGVRIEPSNLIAQLVKWTVLLVTFMVAADALQLRTVTAALNGIIFYIPNVIAAIIIVALGMFLANFVANLVRGASATIKMDTANMLAAVAYWVIVLFAVLAAVGQLNIAPAFVQTLYTALIGAAALAAAIAFGLGLRDTAREYAAGRELSMNFHRGDRLEFEDTAGTIESIGFSTTSLVTAEGHLSVPNSLLLTKVVRIRRSTRT